MSKSAKRFDNQLSIFDLIRAYSGEGEGQAGGRMRVAHLLREAMRAAIKRSPLSRHQIAGEISHLAGESITKEMIDSWTREPDEANGGRGRHIPAEYLPAFCTATGCGAPMRVLGEVSGMFVLPGPDALRAEIQTLDERIQAAKAEKRKRLSFLREMERGK